ncbi:MAG: divalent metal cation transporter, partial [Acidobacteriota bacterium]|nr:divalent metal cation transporter [Acidobacteriota bacterium]
TTITPWMQFYLQASIVEKGVSKRDYAMSRLDVIIGCVVTDVIAFFIVVACAATIFHSQHRDLVDFADAAKALAPFAGKFAAMLFAVGLINASLMSAAILPLATSYNICEGLGFESGIGKRFSEARIFYGLYTALIVGGAGFVLIPNLPLSNVFVISQVANGVLLPFVVAFMLILINRERLMGEYRNGFWANAIAGSTSVIMVGLSIVMIWNTLTGKG